ncbi:MAG: helix-turn-helix transcriptional regulator [Spirochaetales bacterium]|nr:helix-turn-helix transcriptional regulator [Spirochaetales bacterium]
MTDKIKEKEKIVENLLQELNRGTQVLAVLLATTSASYGYSLVQSLKDAGIEIEQNTLYPLLRRLEKQGLLESSWDTGESRPRKYYVRTELGSEIAVILKNEWRVLNRTVEVMIDKEEIE